MATVLTLFFALLLSLTIINGGIAAPCKLSDIAIQQSPTGRTVEGKPEYEVLVSNNCNCRQSGVFLLCYGLSSVETLNVHAIRRVDENRCIVGNGQPIWKGKPVKFTYAWMTPQDFPVVSTQIHC